MKRTFLLLAFSICALFKTYASDFTPQQIKDDAAFSFTLREGVPGTPAFSKEVATAYGRYSYDFKKVYFYVEAADGQTFNGKVDNNFLTTILTKGKGKNGIGKGKIESSVNFINNNKGWITHLDFESFATNNFQIGIAAGFVGDKSGFNSGGGEPNYSTPNVPIDGGLSFLLAAGIGYGAYLRKRKNA